MMKANIMRGALMRLMMIVGVLLCSMHPAEPASANPADSGATYHLLSGDSDRDRQDPAPKMAHDAHHHCPVAANMGDQITAAPPTPTRSASFSIPETPLPSRIVSPLLDPPLISET